MTTETTKSPSPPGRPHRPLTLIALGLAALIVFITLCTLGIWQLQRLAWKEALITQIDNRIHLPAAPAPGPAEWASLNNENAEYRHVTASGKYLFDKQTLVQAVSDLGGGYWVLTPMLMDDGSSILVNRGFVLPAWRKNAQADDPTQARTTVTGLLRMGEPEAALLRENDPAADRWYTRDLNGIAQKRGLDNVAPYSIDADAASSGNHKDPTTAPVGGLTVVKFSNSHLTYAITWFALAAMLLIGVYIVIRDERRRRDYAKSST